MPQDSRAFRFTAPQEHCHTALPTRMDAVDAGVASSVGVAEGFSWRQWLHWPTERGFTVPQAHCQVSLLPRGVLPGLRRPALGAEGRVLLQLSQ